MVPPARPGLPRRGAACCVPCLDTEMTLLAGADARVITPTLGGAPVFLAGFQGDRRATGLHRDLRVRTLALRDEDGRPFVLAVCDLIGLLRRDTLIVRAAVADLGADVVVAATHTHSGPDTIGLWGPDEATTGVDSVDLTRILGCVEASIRAAVAAPEPARLRATSARAEGVVQNYRDPGLVDDDIAVLALERPDGSSIATLMSLGVHPEVLDGGATVVSADIAGACCDAIEAARGGVAVWAAGDLGGMQSPAEGPRTPEEAERKGQLVADAALRALEGVEPLPAPRVRYAGAEVALPLWNPGYRRAIEAGLVRGDLRAEGTIVTDVGVLDLGGARAACWPGEVLPALGLESKQRLATDVPLLIGLANDELGYILPRDVFVEPADWDDPDPHYEESMSVGPETGPLLLEALDALIGGLAT